MKKKPREITTKNYQDLLQKVQKQITETQNKIFQNTIRQKVEMAWEIGKLVAQHLSNNSDSNYGKNLIKRLASDVNIAEKTLYQMHNFYKTYKQLPANNTQLNWSHYRVLSSIKTKSKRKYFEDLTKKNSWNSSQLQLEISSANSSSSALETKDSSDILQTKKQQKLSFTRGKLFSYKISKLGLEKRFFLDCGFKIFREIEESFANELHREGAIVTVEKNSSSYKIKKSNLKSSRQLHTYLARLERVVDGDTIHVILDLGFKIFHQEILRLAKINAPEISTNAGKKSKSELEKILKNNPLLIIKTNKTDIYGRYVADVFFAEENSTPKETANNGTYLNQLLLDRGMVEIF